jgi:tetratricopeptide (TPR) repeat protein
MRQKAVILALIVIFALGLYWVSKVGLVKKQANKGSVDVVFLGDKEYKKTFDQSIKSGKAFSDFFRAGLDSKRVGDYATAIKQFNECLPHAALGPEVAMVYKQLTEIYRAQGNLEKELFYLDQIPKYTMSDRIKKESTARAAELRQLLATQNQTTQTYN